MADYWKSQDRKYCDFCKCWIADNKPSRDFHENGKRHKDNVKKRLKTITKDSAKAFKESAKVEDAIKSMEAAAMEAYRRDMEHNASADLTSMAIAKRVEEENLEIANRKLWHEIPSIDGQKSYYWNTVTNETTWTEPPEGFLSIKEQQEQKSKETLKKMREVNKYEQKEAMLRAQEKDLDDMEERARAARERMKARRVKEDTPPPVYGPIIDPGKNDPYGQWTAVVRESFVMFNNYEIPKENLLNKLGDVTDNGQYVTPFRDPNKRHGAALGALSVGRVTITALCEAYGVKGLTIAIRYSAVRKQFGPDNSPEVPLLEYQTHQYRLLPYLAAAYVLRIFSSKLFEDQYQFAIDSALGNNKEKLPELGTELHAVSSASKPIAGWTMRDAIQECRECCGGHGYLKAARLGDIRNDHDANLTYEGENHVLIQQTANWLIKLWPLVLKGQRIATPLRSVDFLTDGLKILGGVTWKAGNVEEVCQPEIIMSIYQWLVCYLLKSTHDKLENLLAKKDVFWAKNDNQVFHAKNLSIAFIQHFMLQTMLETIQVAPSPEIKAVLTKLFALYGLFSLETYHMTSLYQGEMARGSTPATLIRDAILRLCSELKGEAVALVDVLAPPDFVLNSPLGASDGEVYKRLQSAIFGSPYAMRRPDWWQDITNWKVNVLKGKL
ncbi:peroxisomal acyl-coenzyme A oxidase 3-like isoform X2 [Anthonomus grandis grandis]|uniref:peroxisomal acyl-coenzyme A oxidase 3-like isoform X2 n=1 Tax=Anthonomus grandis grandis TaxID=2921223 RepID=UPI0021650416|nr:peroxisomal acyl-coenzyme A oxidase 3-like isoform X2 [Anthonomus grandis grandis]